MHNCRDLTTMAYSRTEGASLKVQKGVGGEAVSDLRRPQTRRFPWRPYAASLVLILVLALAPIASVLLASLLGRLNGCRLDEANAYPCIILGADWGDVLAGMFVLGWLMLATLPLGAMALLVWLAILLIHLFRRRNLRQVEPET